MIPDHLTIGIEPLVNKTMTKSRSKNHPSSSSGAVVAAHHDPLSDVLDSVDLQISNPSVFCTNSLVKAQSLSLLMKDLFDVATNSSSKTFGPLQELLVENHDGETIWEELQTRNRPVTRFVKKSISSVLKSVQERQRAMEEEGDDEDEEDEKDDDDADDDGDDDDGDDEEKEEGDETDEDEEDEDDEVDEEEEDIEADGDDEDDAMAELDGAGKQ